LDENDPYEKRVYTAVDFKAVVTSSHPETEWIILPSELGNIQALSISTHRDKYPVGAFGQRKVKGFTTGRRTVAGTLVVVLFDRTPLQEILKSNLVESTLADELPPFDIIITLVNELGYYSYTSLLGVELMDQGEVYSTDDNQFVVTYTYMARHRTPIVAGVTLPSVTVSMEGPVVVSGTCGPGKGED
jgi:hypothetical protein